MTLVEVNAINKNKFIYFCSMNIMTKVLENGNLLKIMVSRVVLYQEYRRFNAFNRQRSHFLIN